jgi:TldD protein
MRGLIEEALRGQAAEYIDVRVEESELTRITYRGRQLDEVARARGAGGCVRALVRGGWGFVSFNDLESLPRAVALAVEEARVAGREESRLAPVAPHVDVVVPTIGKDPRTVSLAEKKALLDGYVDVIWSTPKVATATLAYTDTYRRVVFASNEGAYIEQSRIDVTLSASVQARDGADVQQASLSLGALNDYRFVETLADELKALAEKAVAFLSAPHVRGGEYTVILNPVLAGVFCHEAFGHLSEADHIYENPRLQEIMKLGTRFGERHLNIVDGAALPGLRGSYAYDDEGTPAQQTDLIREGILVGRLHSRETAARMGERPTGNARALDYRFPPIVRMTNTYIEPGQARLEDMLEGIKEGIYAANWYGGTTTMEQFTFSAGEAYMIRDGRIAELLRPVVLSGNLFTTLRNIDMVGNDLAMNQGGGCGKGGQVPLPVSTGGPHIRIRNVLVGGR